MNPDDDDYIPSWNGQRTPTADKLYGCTVWFLGFITLMIFAVALTQAIETALQWGQQP